MREKEKSTCFFAGGERKRKCFCWGMWAVEGEEGRTLLYYARISRFSNPHNPHNNTERLRKRSQLLHDREEVISPSRHFKNSFKWNRRRPRRILQEEKDGGGIMVWNKWPPAPPKQRSGESRLPFTVIVEEKIRQWIQQCLLLLLLSLGICWQIWYLIKL